MKILFLLNRFHIILSISTSFIYSIISDFETDYGTKIKYKNVHFASHYIFFLKIYTFLDSERSDDVLIFLQ